MGKTRLFVCLLMFCRLISRIAEFFVLPALVIVLEIFSYFFPLKKFFGPNIFQFEFLSASFLNFVLLQNDRVSNHKMTASAL